MGCCNGRTEDPFKFSTTQAPVFETKSRSDSESDDILRQSISKNLLSIREIAKKPLISSIPKGKTHSILIIHKTLSRRNDLWIDKTFSFLASLDEEYEYLAPEIEAFRAFEVICYRISEENQVELIEFYEKLRGIKRNIEHLSLIFNFELLAEDRFLVKSLISKKKINKLNSFFLMIYKENLPVSLSEFIENSLQKPGIFEEMQLIQLLFSLARTLRNLQEIGLEFEDLNEELFSIDLKGIGTLKIDPSKRKFYIKKDKNLGFISLKGYLAPELQRKTEEKSEIDEKTEEKNEINEEKNEITEENTENGFVLIENSKNNKKSAVFSLAVLFLRLTIGKGINPKNLIGKTLINNDFQEIFSLKYPKLWFFLEKMLEEIPEKRISFENLLEKSSFFFLEHKGCSKLEFLSFIPSQQFDEIQHKTLNFDDFFEIIDIIDGNSLIFQEITALNLLKELRLTLIRKGLFLFDDKFIEIANRTSKIHFSLENYPEALEEFSFLENAMFFSKNIENTIRFQMALCYKYLNKTAKSLQIFIELARNSGKEIEKAKAINEIAEIHLENKEFELCKQRLFEAITIMGPLEQIEYKASLADSYEIFSKLLILSEENYVESLEYVKKAHNLRKNLYNSESLVMIKSYKCLALGFLNIGEVKSSLKALSKNLSLLKTRENLCINAFEAQKLRKFRAESLKILSKLQIEVGEAEKAEKTYKEVLEIYEEIYGFYSGELACELHELAGFYNSINLLEKALETFQITAEVLKSVFGEKSLKVAENWSLLGEFHEENGRFSEGIDALLESLKIRLEIFGGVNQSMIGLFLKISKNYELLGFQSKAVEFGEKGLELLREAIGVKKDDTRIFMMNFMQKYIKDDSMKNIIKNDSVMHSMINSPDKKKNSAVNDEILKNFMKNSPDKKNNSAINDDILKNSPDKKDSSENSLKSPSKETIPLVNGSQTAKNKEKDKKSLLIEGLFRMGSLYRKMGMTIKARSCFAEQKSLTFS